MQAVATAPTTDFIELDSSHAYDDGTLVTIGAESNNVTFGLRSIF